VSLQWKDDSWVVTYYVNHSPTFQRLDSKDEVMDLIQGLKEENGGHLMLNDVSVYPPRTDLPASEIITYGVPDFLVKEMKR
jgi:hypothetical protein